MATYPDDWRVFLVNEENLPKILAHGKYAKVEDLVENLNAHIDYEEPRNDGCGAFSSKISDITSEYPGYNNNGKYLRNYFAISRTAGIIGILSIEQIEHISNGLNIFIHESGMVRALVGKVSWTCSFTNSPVIFREKSVRNRIGSLAGIRKINMGKYIADETCKLLLDEFHEFNITKKYRDINRVLLFSVGIDSARHRHRKNGKLTACRFLEEWTNDDENTIMTAYGHEEFMGSLMFYLFDDGGKEFYDSKLYHDLLSTGSDLSQIIDGSLDGNARYANTNYTCPSGMTFSKFGLVNSEGSPYEFRPLPADSSSSSSSSSGRKGGSRRTTRSKGRRRACGRPSRRRGNN